MFLSGVGRERAAWAALQRGMQTHEKDNGQLFRRLQRATRLQSHLVKEIHSLKGLLAWKNPLFRLLSLFTFALFVPFGHIGCLGLLFCRSPLCPGHRRSPHGRCTGTVTHIFIGHWKNGATNAALVWQGSGDPCAISWIFSRH